MTGIGHALGTDYFLIRADLGDAERGYLDRTRRFVEDEVLPVITIIGSAPRFRSASCAGSVS